MPATLPPEALDRILTLQLAVAWAGEGSCEPARLGWWKTDLIDRDGGGYLLAHLLPLTHEWASLQAVREAAVATEAGLRAALGGELLTLFHLGFEIDERLRDRLGQLKRQGRSPRVALPGLPDLTAPFTAESFERFLLPDGNSVASVVVPGGRELKGEVPAEADQLALRLGKALVPFVKPYPLPFCRVRA